MSYQILKNDIATTTTTKLWITKIFITPKIWVELLPLRIIQFHYNIISQNYMTHALLPIRIIIYFNDHEQCYTLKIQLLYKLITSNYKIPTLHLQILNPEWFCSRLAFSRPDKICSENYEKRKNLFQLLKINKGKKQYYDDGKKSQISRRSQMRRTFPVFSLIKLWIYTDQFCRLWQHINRPFLWVNFDFLMVIANCNIIDQRELNSSRMHNAVVVV